MTGVEKLITYTWYVSEIVRGALPNSRAASLTRELVLPLDRLTGGLRSPFILSTSFHVLMTSMVNQHYGSACAMAVAYALLVFVLGDPNVDAYIMGPQASPVDAAYRWVASCYLLFSAAVCLRAGRQWEQWATQLERASQAKSIFLATMR